jgi:hypothetical protein
VTADEESRRRRPWPSGFSSSLDAEPLADVVPAKREGTKEEITILMMPMFRLALQ